MGTHLGVGYLLRVACACLSVEQLRGLITTVFSLPGPCLFRADGVMGLWRRTKRRLSDGERKALSLALSARAVGEGSG